MILGNIYFLFCLRFYMLKSNERLIVYDIVNNIKIWELDMSVAMSSNYVKANETQTNDGKNVNCSLRPCSH